VHPGHLIVDDYDIEAIDRRPRRRASPRIPLRPRRLDDLTADRFQLSASTRRFVALSTITSTRLPPGLHSQGALQLPCFPEFRRVV